MAYFAPYIDAAGLHLPTYVDIRDGLINQMRQIYGNDIYLDEDAQDYQFISIFAQKIYDNQQSLLLAYNNSSPRMSVGTALDRLVQLNGIKRRVPLKSKIVATIIGAAGTVINSGVLADVHGNKWDLPVTYTIPASGEGTVIAESQAFGIFLLAPHELTVIETPVYGWSGVDNLASSIPGDAGETDSALKAKQSLSTSRPSRTVFESTIGDIYNLAGVTRVKGYENPTGATVNTLPPHSIALVVEGGSDAAIAQTIFLRKTPGTATFGTTTVHAFDNSGALDINFSRPSYVHPAIVVNVKKLSTWSGTLTDLIKSEIVAYLENFAIGEDVYTNNLSGPIMGTYEDASNPAFYIQSLTVGGSAAVYEVPMFSVIGTVAADITVNAT